MTNPISKCCKAPLYTAHGCDSDMGHGGKKCNCASKGGVTMWYECSKCKKPTDIYEDTKQTPKSNSASTTKQVVTPAETEQAIPDLTDLYNDLKKIISPKENRFTRSHGGITKWEKKLTSDGIDQLLVELCGLFSEYLKRQEAEYKEKIERAERDEMRALEALHDYIKQLKQQHRAKLESLAKGARNAMHNNKEYDEWDSALHQMATKIERLLNSEKGK